MGRREIQVRAGPTSSAGETTRARLCGGCTRALAPPGAPRCPGRCHPTNLVFSFSYTCQVLVRSLMFLQKAQLKSRRVTGMLRCLQTARCSLAPGPSRDGRAGTTWREGTGKLGCHPERHQSSQLPPAHSLGVLSCSCWAAVGIYPIPPVYLTKQAEKYLYSLL